MLVVPMEQRRDIHGHVVYSDNEAKDGLNYLDYDLKGEAAEAFFRQAKQTGSAMFEDEHERRFTLTYKGGAYYVERI